MTAKEKRILVECITEGVKAALLGIKIVQEKENPVTGKTTTTAILGSFQEDEKVPA